MSKRHKSKRAKDSFASERDEQTTTQKPFPLEATSIEPKKGIFEKEKRGTKRKKSHDETEEKPFSVKPLYEVKGVQPLKPMPELQEAVLGPFPQIITIVGPTQAGKTALYSNMLLRKAWFGPDNVENNKGGYFDHIYILTSTGSDDESFQRLKTLPYITVAAYTKPLLDSITTSQEQVLPEDRQPIAMVIDDTKATPHIDELAKIHRHKGIIFLCVCSQTYKHMPASRNNASNVFLMAGIQRQILAGVLAELGPLYGGAKQLEKYYNEATVEKYSWLLLNIREQSAFRPLRKDEPGEIRLRCLVKPKKYTQSNAPPLVQAALRENRFA